MLTLCTIRGRITDLRRYNNNHFRHRRQLSYLSERYEFWLRQSDRRERKFTIHTGSMPARRGHRVSVIALAEPAPDLPEVFGLVNEETGDAVNYVRSDPPWLLRGRDFIVLPMAFAALTAAWGMAGVLLFVPLAPLYLIAAIVSRAIRRAARARQVDAAIAQAQTRWTQRPHAATSFSTDP